VNVGSLTLGFFDGLLVGLLAVGLVLVYRSNRFLNLAHGQLGALPALLLPKFVIDLGWGYWPAIIVCLVLGSGTGIVIDRFLISRLLRKTKSSVSALLFTIGVTNLLAFFLVVPAFEPNLTELGRLGYPLPFNGTFEIDGVVFGGQYIAILVFCPALVAGLFAFLKFSVFGKMIRAAASNQDAARLCGISPRVVSGITWGIAGGLSTFSAVLAAPNQSGSLGVGSGLSTTQLFLALGAASFGAFVSIPWTLVGGLAIGMTNQFVIFETSNAGTARLAVFGLILAVILFRGRSIGAAFAASGAATDDLSPLRIPERIRSRAIVKNHRSLLIGGALLVGAVAPFLPPLEGESERFRLSVILIYALIALSLTMLIGWAGQLSLGHMAVVGIGAYAAGRLALNDYSMISLLFVSGALGAFSMVAIGIPALRVRGLTLAVTTLGLAVVGGEYLFRSEWFTGSVTSFVTLDRPIAPLRGLETEGQLTVYFSCLAVLAIAAIVLSSLRNSTPGRMMISVRDDERAAAAYGVTPLTVKVTALAISGAIAGMAGVLWASSWQTVAPGQFPPALSLSLLTLPVIGGIGSVSGAIGATVLLYFPVQFWTTYLGDTFGDAAQTAFFLLMTGLSSVIVLLFIPTGLAGVVQGSWERVLKRIEVQAGARAREVHVADGAVPILSTRDIHLSFGGVKALQGATIEVHAGEIVGLIGPNGAGKSTLVNVMSGVLSADRGEVVLDGHDVSHLAPEMRASLGMGRSFQAATLFPGLTVLDTVKVMLGARAHIGVVSSAIGAPWSRRTERRIHAEASTLVERMGLGPWAKMLTADLSTGTRRICDLTVQVASGSKVLLLDEPTGGVAQRETEAFGPLLRQIRDELDCAIVIVEHDMPLLMGLCDRVYAMVEGAVIAEGSPSEIRENPVVIASYLGTDETAIERSGARSSTTVPERAPSDPDVAERQRRRRREPLTAGRNP